MLPFFPPLPSLHCVSYTTACCFFSIFVVDTLSTSLSKHGHICLHTSRTHIPFPAWERAACRGMQVSGSSRPRCSLVPPVKYMSNSLHSVLQNEQHCYIAEYGDIYLPHSSFEKTGDFYFKQLLFFPNNVPMPGRYFHLRRTVEEWKMNWARASICLNFQGTRSSTKIQSMYCIICHVIFPKH